MEYEDIEERPAPPDDPAEEITVIDEVDTSEDRPDADATVGEPEAEPQPDAEAEAAEPEAAEPEAESEPSSEASPDVDTVVIPAEPADQALPTAAEADAPDTADAVDAPAAGESAPAAKADREDAQEQEEEESAPSIVRGPGEWYVVHTYSGYENKVKANLHQRIGSMQMEDKIFDVVIPLEDVMEIKGGKKQVVQRKVFPGYLLVRMIYDNDSWYVVRNTPGVTGFVSSGTGTKPTPLSQREVEKILAVKKDTEKKPEYRLEWEEGDVVRIVAGPFADFTGTISEINVEQSKLRVMVNIFDRETPVELAFDQVAKA